MEYEGRICTGPIESAAFRLPCTVGCSYNACKFCGLFKDLKYREIPLEQIEAEILRVKNIGGKPRSIFLGDGNALHMSMERLLTILDMIHDAFPDCNTINMDATITDVKRKSDEELKRLYEEGVRHLYIGIETGLDDVLKFMRKDHDLESAYREVYRLKEAGLIFDAHIMTGVAGKGRGMENAMATAEFFNKTQPNRIVNFSIFHGPRHELWKDILAGKYVRATELENLEEDVELVKLLDVDGLFYDSFHDCRINLRARGTLPKDRERILWQLTQAIEKEKEYLASQPKEA